MPKYAIHYVDQYGRPRLHRDDDGEAAIWGDRRLAEAEARMLRADRPRVEFQVVEHVDAPGLGYVIEELFVAVAQGDEGEGLVTVPMGALTVPLVRADRAGLVWLRHWAEATAKHFGKPVQIIRLSVREELERFEP